MVKKIDFRIVCLGLGCLTLLEGIALSKGIDGTIYSLVIAAIAGICGWSLPQLKIK